MKAFGLKLPENRSYREFFFKEDVLNSALSRKELKRCSYSVEGDWSNGAFLLVAGAIAGNITVKGLNIFSHQPDKEILKVLEAVTAIVLADLMMLEGNIKKINN